MHRRGGLFFFFFGLVAFLPAVAPAQTAAGGSCDSKKPFRVGAVYDLSGAQTATGRNFVDGSKLATEDINSSGGILGRCVQLIYKDAAGNPTTAAQITRQFVDDDKVEFLVGPTTGSTTLSSIPITTAARTLQIVGTSTPSVGDASKYPYVFGTEMDSGLLGEQIGQKVKESGTNKLGVLVLNGPTGDGFMVSIRDVAKRLGLEIVATESVKEGQIDMVPLVRHLKEAGATVYIIGLAAIPDCAAAIKARNQLLWDVPIYGFSTLGTPEVLQSVGPENLKRVYAAQQYRSISRNPGETSLSFPLAEEFRTKYKKLTGQNPLQRTLNTSSGGYDELMLAATAINKVGKNDPDLVREYLEKNGHRGIRAQFRFSSASHLGIGLSEMAFGEVSTLSDGALEISK